ncbi:phage minor capsid protein [Oscillibacter sp.]|uniref:phage minor capsid protein n=1 Tax=Oscillibacter sp. TaxID=1945593 RepID=UPI002899CF67|nr:phage minor capsid protein [Oscillibacter sp.]
MLTPDQIAALRDAATKVSDPITEYLIADIARRISEAGQFTSTAQYEVWRTQQLGISQREIRERLQRLLGKSSKEINALLTQSAEVGYNFDLKNLPTSAAIPFEQNAVMQQIVSASVKLAQSDFTNITQTLGMVDPYGNALLLQDVYRSATDFAFKQVFTGATDYNTAIRQATRNIAKYGLRTIDYESGVHTSMEAAVRRNIMGGLGLMQEQISQQNHDDMGADGWEISAHGNCAPDHEPIQGNQYSDAAYIALNDSLKRRIGTLNCGHAAYPIIMGVNSPQYTPGELKEFREANTDGITYQGKHFTGYEATQQQRALERAIRAQKRSVLIANQTTDADYQKTAKTRLTLLNQEYRRFSKAAGLRTQMERAQVAGFGRAAQGVL